MNFERKTRHRVRPMQRHGHDPLRFGLAFIFIAFGAPKMVPGLSPAEELVKATVTWFDAVWFVPLLGMGEVLIGVCLLNRAWLRVGLVLMGGHMMGTALPLFTLPQTAWKEFPVPSLEGQYILKNVVLVAAGIVLAAENAWGQARPPGSISRLRSRHRGPSPIGARVAFRAEYEEPEPRESGNPSAPHAGHADPWRTRSCRSRLSG